MNPPPQQPRKPETVTESYLAIVASYEDKEEQNPRAPLSEQTTTENLLAIFVTVDCGKESLVLPKPEPPTDNPPTT
jgi:hypothetical protein